MDALAHGSGFPIYIHTPGKVNPTLAGDNDFVSSMLNLMVPFYPEAITMNVTRLPWVTISEVCVEHAGG